MKKKKHNYKKVDNKKKRRRKKKKNELSIYNVMESVNTIFQVKNAKRVLNTNITLILMVNNFALIIVHIWHCINRMHINIISFIMEKKDYVVIHVNKVCILSKLTKLNTVNWNVMGLFMKIIFLHMMEVVYPNVR